MWEIARFLRELDIEVALLLIRLPRTAYVTTRKPVTLLARGLLHQREIEIKIRQDYNVGIVNLLGRNL